MTISSRLMVAALKAHLETEDKPVIPPGGSLFWKWFMDLSRRRSYHASGPNAIDDAQILAYRSNHRIPMEPRHIDVLKAMDDAFLEAVYAKRATAPEGAKTLPPISKRALSAGLFDAMMG